MALVDQLRHRWTRAEYALLQDGQLRCELIDGEIVDVSPMSNRHRQAVMAIASTLVRSTDPVRYAVGCQLPIVLDDSSEPEPDVWVAHGAEASFVDRPMVAEDLVLVVEVSDGSLRFDREVKLPLYATALIPEVWIVDVAAGTITTHRVPVGDQYGEVTELVRTEAVEVPWGGSLPIEQLLHGAR
jgi:Uma2 family endonuclease